MLNVCNCSVANEKRLLFAGALRRLLLVSVVKDDSSVIGARLEMSTGMIHSPFAKHFEIVAKM